MTKAHPNEGDVKKKVKELLDRHDYFWWSPPARAFGKTGIPDIQAVKTGMFMSVETKYGSNKATEIQRAFLTTLNAAGHFAFVVNEKNLDYFEAFLGALDRSIEAAEKNKQPTPEDGAMMTNALIELTKGFAE